MDMFDGILLIDKEKGWTSHDVVAKLRGILTKEKRHLHEGRGSCMEIQRKDVASSSVKDTNEYDARATQPADLRVLSKNGGADGSASSQTIRCKCRVKVGHTGTLDPLATGLMIVVVGKYCKRAQEFSKLDKVYEVTTKLGFNSDTGDAEGELTKKSDHEPFAEEVQNVIEQFIGVISQTPPAYSAIKVDGKRAYQLAREGKQVKLEPRKVKIHTIEPGHVRGPSSHMWFEFPVARFTCRVSSGTYIRSLVTDIGEKLGTGGYMSDLRRTRVGEFDLEDAHTIEQLQTQSLAGVLEQVT